MVVNKLSKTRWFLILNSCGEFYNKMLKEKYIISLLWDICITDWCYKDDSAGNINTEHRDMNKNQLYFSNMILTSLNLIQILTYCSWTPCKINFN